MSWRRLRGFVLSLGFLAMVPPWPVDKSAGQDARSGQTIAGAPTNRRAQLTVQMGHSEAVTSVAFSPDGRRVVTAGNDRTARLWNADNGAELMVLQARVGDDFSPFQNPLNSEIYSVAFAPDGKSIATGGAKGEIRLWDADTGQEIRGLFPALFGEVRSLAFASDGKRVLAVRSTPSMYDAANGRLIDDFKKQAYKPGFGQAFVAQCGALSPDDAKLALGLGQATVVWDLKTGKEFLRLPRGARAVAFSADGKWLLTGHGDKTAVLWDAGSGQQLRTFEGHANAVSSVAISRDGKFVATAGGSDKTARVWNAATGEAMHVLQGHSDNVTAVAFAPDGTQVATGSRDQTAKLWDTASGRELHALQRQALVVNAVAISPDGTQALLGNSDGTARLWDLATGKNSHTFRGHTGEVTSVAFSPDGQQVLTGGDRTARVWHAGTGVGLAAYTFFPGVRSAVFSPDGKQILAGGGTSTTASAVLWNAASGKVIHQFPAGQAVEAVAFSPDGQRIVTGSRASGIRLWEANSGKLVAFFKQGVGFHRVTSVAFAPDGQQVAAGTETTAQASQGEATRWDVSGLKVANQPTQTHYGHRGEVTCLAYSHDGTRLITGSRDRTARIWDAAGRSIILQGHAAELTSVAFSPDGKFALTGGRDGSARLWNAATGMEICQRIGFRDGSWAVVAPDSHYMASRGNLPGVMFRIGARAFTFDQFDLAFNRPEVILQRIGKSPPTVIAAYRQAFQKRLQRMRVTEASLGDDFHVPTLAVRADAKFSTRMATLKLAVQASDAKYALDRLHIDVNGVPLRGMAGISLRQPPTKAWDGVIDVELSPGKNKIDVSVLNEKGAESLKESLTITHDAPARKPSLYLVAVGVSDYHDARFRLTYADKDARDLVEHYARQRDRFAEVKTLRLLNRDATAANILKAKAFLKETRVDDLVVVFFAGHGLLDAKFDYYFATTDVDFKNPSQRGLPYEAIEDLLDGIRARQKLLLMDTCHSGELDTEDVQIARAETTTDDAIKVRSIRGLDFEVTPKVGLANSYQLLQTMFADLRRGTGAVVISSAGGAEYALESAAWKNGVFTHAVLRGLGGEADKNKDGRVQVSELRDFVEQEVRRLTRGRQTPTARRENLVIDFAVD